MGELAIGLIIGGLLTMAVGGIMRLHRPDAHDPISPHDPWLYTPEPKGSVRVPGAPSSLAEAIEAERHAHTPWDAYAAQHAASSQRSVAKALEVYECTELERRLSAHPEPSEPSYALEATMTARNLGAILKALRG